MRDHEDEIEAAGAGIAAIGTGDLRYAEAFADDRDIDFPLMIDPQLESYQAVAARKARWSEVVTPAGVIRGIRALASGQLQGRTGKHPLMLGATHVITPEGEVPLAWVNDDTSDNAPVTEVLRVLDTAS